MGQCRLINYNKKYHSDGDCWGGYEWEGSGIIWGISVPSAQFFCEPKTALKYKGYKGSWPIKSTNSAFTQMIFLCFIYWIIYLGNYYFFPRMSL